MSRRDDDDIVIDGGVEADGDGAPGGSGASVPPSRRRGRRGPRGGGGDNSGGGEGTSGAARNGPGDGGVDGGEGDDDDGLDKPAGGATEEFGLEAGAFEALEKDFHDVLQELIGDRSLARFRVEYEKLHRALIKSHTNEKRLIDKCRTLNAEIVTNSAKVQAVLELSREDQDTIASLKKEIEKAWRMVDTAHEKEKKAKETIAALRAEIEKLTTLVEEGAGFSIGQESSVNELFRVKTGLEEANAKQKDLILSLRQDLEAEREKLNKVHADKQAVEHSVQNLQEVVRKKNQDLSQMANEKTRHEEELELARQTLAAQREDILNKEQQLKAELVKQNELKRNLNRDRERVTALEQEKRTLQQKEEELGAQVIAALSEKKEKKDELKALMLDYRRLENELLKEKRRQEREERAKEDADRKRLEWRQKYNDAVARGEELEAEKAALENELEGQVAQARKFQSDLKLLKRQKNALANNRETVQRTVDEQAMEMDNINQEKDSLEKMIADAKRVAQRQRKQIHDLEKDRDHLKAKAIELSTKLHQAEEEVKIRDLHILDKKKKLQETRIKLKQRHLLYEQVRSERNMYSKQLVESKDDIAEYKRKFNILNHQIVQLKEEIAVKEQAIFTEHMTHMRVQKIYAAKQGQLAVLKSQIYEARKYQQAQEEEITKLKHIINEADAERMRQKKALEAARNERDILGTQLIRRNDELALLYEKIKIQKYTLKKGEQQYGQRMGEIRVLKQRIKARRHDLAILQKKATHVEDLKRTVYELQRDLLQERNRVKALSEELQNPMNIHRWRQLEGTDPHAYELIQKIQTLQKRLIAKTEEVVAKELLIAQKEKYYMELKQILARQPGPDVAEQLNVYEANLKEKKRQLKAMAAELNMYQAQVNEYKYENERLARTLNDYKKRYFRMKKSEDTRRLRAADERAAAATLPMPGAAALGEGVTRKVGGGFAIS